MAQPEFVFDKKLLAKGKIPKFEHFIGVDTYDEKNFCYCLVRKSGDNTDIVMAKNMKIKAEFDKEVENMMKYFNAKKSGK